MNGPHVICEGPAFGEGPVWCAATGTLVCTSVSEGVLYRVWPASGRRELLADVGGGTNGAALCADGGLLVTQNGGLDFSKFGIFENPPPPRHTRAGLQRVAPDGTGPGRVVEENQSSAGGDAFGTAYVVQPGQTPRVTVEVPRGGTGRTLLGLVVSDLVS